MASIYGKQIRLALGKLLLGGPNGNALEVSGTVGQTLVVNASGEFEVRALTAVDVSATAVANTNIDGATVADQLQQLAEHSPYAHSAATDPTVGWDSADTANVGLVFKVGDEVTNTVSKAVFKAVDVTAGAAVWVRIDNTATTQTPKRELYTHSGGSQTGDVLLTGFFTGGVPLTDSETIFIGPLPLTWGTEYTISGTDLTLHMAVIGYALDDGDIVAARYLTA